jgi:hypothetical protein
LNDLHERKQRELEREAMLEQQYQKEMEEALRKQEEKAKKEEEARKKLLNDVESERQRQLQWKQQEKERQLLEKQKDHEQMVQEQQRIAQEEAETREKMKRAQTAHQMEIRSQLETRLIRQRQELMVDNSEEQQMNEQYMKRLQDEMAKGQLASDHRRKATITKIPPRK